MKKLILFVLCALSGLMVSAQSRWGITPEGGFAAVNRVGMGSSWRAGVIRWEIIRERRSLLRMS